MRTTINIPDAIFRQVKSSAALRGMKLKEYVAEALRDSLVRHGSAGEVREAQEPYGDAEIQDLGPGCVLPLITGETGPEMRSMTGARINEILEEEEVAAALHPGRRQRVVGDSGR